MKQTSTLQGIFFGTSLTSAIALAETPTLTVVFPAQVAVTQPLGHACYGSEKHEVHNHKPLPNRGGQSKPDGALQNTPGPLINANPGARFPGIGAGGSAPPAPLGSSNGCATNNGGDVVA
jgi:hypothetical protein